MAKAPADIRSLARTHTALALRVLKEIAGSPKANTSARVSAAVALLDRGWGKPKQELTVEHKNIVSELSDGDLESIINHPTGSGNGASAPTNGASEPDKLH